MTSRALLDPELQALADQFQGFEVSERTLGSLRELTRSMLPMLAAPSTPEAGSRRVAYPRSIRCAQSARAAVCSKEPSREVAGPWFTCMAAVMCPACRGL